MHIIIRHIWPVDFLFRFANLNGNFISVDYQNVFDIPANTHTHTH